MAKYTESAGAGAAVGGPVGALGGFAGGAYAGWETAGQAFDAFWPGAGMLPRVFGGVVAAGAGMSIGTPIGFYGGLAAGGLTGAGAAAGANAYSAGKERVSAGANRVSDAVNHFGFSDDETDEVLEDDEQY